MLRYPTQDWKTTTFAEGSAARSVISAPNSTIVVGTNMLIGGLLKVIVHRPGWVRSVLNCEGSGMAHPLLSSKRLAQNALRRETVANWFDGARRTLCAYEEFYRSDLKPGRERASIAAALRLIPHAPYTRRTNPASSCRIVRSVSRAAHGPSRRELS